MTEAAVIDIDIGKTSFHLVAVDASGAIQWKRKFTGFKRGRDLAAWLGLVLRQHSTGGKSTLLGMSKRGNSHLRRLFVHGARSASMHVKRDRGLGPWLEQLET